MGNRLDDLRKFYSLLERLEHNIGGVRKLEECSGRMFFPDKGVYFFQEPGEFRTDSGHGPRVVRVGTHALRADSSTTLWNRLSQHRGQAKTAGGNHRGSIFRLIIGQALIARYGQKHPTWGNGQTASKEIRASEFLLERQVSGIVGEMPFLWLPITDVPGPESQRGYIERNCIAMLSNFKRIPLDPPSQNWLGLHSSRERVGESGLWNSDHVDEKCDPKFLDKLEELISSAVPPA